MKRELLAAAILAGTSLLSGCLAYTGGYCDGNEVAELGAPAGRRFPVTYSVECIQSDFAIALAPEYGGKTEGDFVRGVGEALEKTGMFASVRYADRPGNDAYHIAFRFYRSGTGIYASDLDCLICASLTLIPVGCETSIDASADIFVRGKSIAGFGEAETGRIIYWLPFLPFFFTGLTYIDNMDEAVMNAIVNDVAAYHYENFVLRNTPVYR